MNVPIDGNSLNLIIKPSRQWKKCLLVFHVLAITMLDIAALPALVEFACNIVVLVSGCVINRQLQRQDQQGKQIRYTASDGWQIKLGTSTFLAADIMPATWIGSSLIVLQFRVEKHQYIWPIFADAMSADEFRRLRVYLRTVS